MDNFAARQNFPIGRFIKEIGRGRKGARSISREEAYAVYAAMLDGRVSDLEMGGLMLAMRIKGESVDEIAGFLDAAEASYQKLPVPEGEFAPIVIPTYNGSRQLPNLTPLLALLLAREGAPVLLHGVATDPGRVATAEILQRMGLAFCRDADDVRARFAKREPAFMTIDTLAPRMAHLLSLRRVLGVRNSTHTLVKLIQPFAGPALRLTSYTHPDYLALLTEYFSIAAPPGRGDVFLMRGTEGETVANAKRGQQIEWFHAGQRAVLSERQDPVNALPALPQDSDAGSTAAWIEQALRGEQPVPAPISVQAEHCLMVARQIKAGQAG